MYIWTHLGVPVTVLKIKETWKLERSFSKNVDLHNLVFPIWVYDQFDHISLSLPAILMVNLGYCSRNICNIYTITLCLFFWQVVYVPNTQDTEYVIFPWGRKNLVIPGFLANQVSKCYIHKMQLVTQKHSTIFAKRTRERPASKEWIFRPKPHLGLVWLQMAMYFNKLILYQ